MAGDNTTSRDVERALAETERTGLSIVLSIRTALAVIALVLILLTQGIPRGVLGAGVAAVFLVIGLAYHAVVLLRRDRIWMRYAFATADIVLLAAVAALVPLAQEGEVPQIFVFRVYSIGIFFFVLATSALSLSPGLVLWSGGALVVSIWAAWGWIVFQMDRVVTWANYAGTPTAENYVRIVLDPDMIALSNRITETILIIATALVTAAAVQRARTLLRRQIATERERAEVAEVFGRFVPEEVVDTLSESGGTLVPEKRFATVMFVDIAGFTTLSEPLDPRQIVALLDAFFDEVGTIAREHRGVCISLIGDAALIAFNAPLENPTHAASALAAAEALIACVAERRFEGQALQIRVGIATGPVAAGTVGGRGRRSYTLYGDTVNVAQRLEALNKQSGHCLTLDEATWLAAGRPAYLEPAGEISVRGRGAPVGIYSAPVTSMRRER